MDAPVAEAQRLSISGPNIIGNVDLNIDVDADALSGGGLVSGGMGNTQMEEGEADKFFPKKIMKTRRGHKNSQLMSEAERRTKEAIEKINEDENEKENSNQVARHM